MNKRRKVIGIIAAMESEITTIWKILDTEKVECIGGMDFHIGTHGNHKAVVVQCGMGKVNAAMGTTILMERYHVDTVINVGCAGSLNDKLDIGDFVISEDVVQHDFDVSAIGHPKGEVPYTGRVSFPADRELIEAARKAIQIAAPKRKSVIGRICTGDQFISSDKEKARIIDGFHGDCAEMEGAAVGQTAFLYEVPFVILRAVSDKASSKEGSADFSRYVDEVTREGAEVVLNMLELI